MVNLDIQVNTGDSISCTNLSICTSIGTVISRSALRQASDEKLTKIHMKRTICKVGLKRVHKPVREDTEKRQQLHCDTMTGTTS